MIATWRYLLILPLCFSLFICTACRKDKPVAHQKTLRVSTEKDAQTLDPRCVRDLGTTTTIHMLYEGLMRSQKDGQIVPAMAESVSISPDQKTYTFQLRRSFWSNGEPVTAQDFEETWKSALDPQFPCPNAYQFYVIQGAQSAKEGKAPLQEVGVRAENDSTLIVTLEQPTPYFLQLAATHFYYPVHASLRKQALHAEPLSDSAIVTNGPFQLEKWNRQNEFSAVPNPYYWDKKSVHLDRIALIVLDNPVALQAFQRGELEWTGSPLSTISTDAIASLKRQRQLEVMPAAGVYLIRLNTERAPFDQPKMRQAFALALNRTDLVEHALQGNQIPALGIVPPSFLKGKPFFQDHDVTRAQQLFQEALAEQGLTLQNFPQVAMCYANNERAHKIAQVAQQYWKNVLGVQVDLQSCESKIFLERLKKQDYQAGIGSWFADIRDPISFLEVFKFKSNGTNNTQWESPQFIALLDQSAQATQIAQRDQLLKAAEKTLMQDMPIIPLFYSSYNYVKQPTVKGVYFSELGYLDFKHAYLDTH